MINLSFILQSLGDICGSSSIIYKPELLISYTQDWRKRYHGTAIAVVFPYTVEQIQQLVKFCGEHQIALIPQGGNTSTCGAATPLANYTQPQLIINLQKLNKIIEIDQQNYSITVEAGCTLQQIHNSLSAYGLHFPLTLASQDSCQIGGNLATNAGGTQVIKYGMIRDLTLGLQAVMPDGSLINQLYKLRKNNTYFDLKQLLIGSEGTLGIITHACLKIYPQPPQLLTFLCACDTISQALELLAKLKYYYTNNVSSFEIIKFETWQIYQHYFPLDPEIAKMPWSIIAEIEINNDFIIDNLIDIFGQCKIDLTSTIIAINELERKKLWQLREQIPLAEKQYGYAAKHDIALPLSNLEDFLAENMPKLIHLIPNGYFSIFGHLGDGNLHYNFGLANSSLVDLAELEHTISPIVYTDVIKYSGTISAEHGIGQSKIFWLKNFYTSAEYQLLSQIKSLIDPQNLFNPSKVILKS
ncbi:MAG: hypothetical protein RLZZ293_319 [Pseudomonadota bacterium]|jgi:FAD/FMN-containing dehydrogenase